MSKPEAVETLKKTKQVKDIVKTSTVAVLDSKPHAMKELFGDASSVPVLKSVGIAKIPGSNSFVSFVVKTKGREVLEVEVDEPNARYVAEDMTKVHCMELFGSEE